MKKNIAKKILIWLLFWVAGLTSIARGGEIYIESADGNYKLIPSIALQFQHKTVNSNQSENTSGFFIRRGRIKIEGNLITPALEYEVEFDTGTPDKEDSQFDLKDFYFDYNGNFLRIKAGQFKTPFGLQELTSSKKQQFVDRSLASEEFVHGRDIGVMLAGQQKGKFFGYSFGIFNGEGDNNKTTDTENLYALRMVFQPLGEYKEEESDLKGIAVYRLILGANAFYTRDIVSSDYLLVLGSFAGFKFSGFSLRVEYFDRLNMDDTAAANESMDGQGYYAQTGYFLFPQKIEVALRRSQIFRPDTNNEETTSTVFNYFFKGHHAKLQLDYTFQVIEGTQDKEDHLIRTQFQFYF